MATRPHRRAGRPRTTFADRFLEKLQELSGDTQKFITRDTLMNRLGWDDRERYDRIKESLKSQGKIAVGRGGGGMVALASPPDQPPPEPLKVFISYSTHDEDLKEKLVKHLNPLEKSSHIKLWHFRKITPCENFQQSIIEKLRNSDVVLLLISIDFVNSKYCFELEMEQAF